MQLLMNDGWTFALTKLGEKPNAEEFHSVALPHDWLIARHENLYADGSGWYRRRLFVKNSRDGKTRMLYFDGVYMDCDITVNDALICTHRYGYTAFYADMTEALSDGENIIEIHVRHQSPNSRWYSGAGIYRDVHYIELPACHIAPDGVYVHTRRVSENTWEVHVDCEIVGDSDGEKPLHRLLDAEGVCVFEGEQILRVNGALQTKGRSAWSALNLYGKTDALRLLH